MATFSGPIDNLVAHVETKVCGVGHFSFVLGNIEPDLARLVRGESRIVLRGTVKQIDEEIDFYADGVWAAPVDPGLLAKLAEHDRILNQTAACMADADRAIAHENEIGDEIGYVNTTALYVAGARKVACRNRHERVRESLPWIIPK